MEDTHKKRNDYSHSQTTGIVDELLHTEVNSVDSDKITDLIKNSNDISMSGHENPLQTPKKQSVSNLKIDPSGKSLKSVTTKHRIINLTIALVSFVVIIAPLIIYISQAKNKIFQAWYAADAKRTVGCLIDGNCTHDSVIADITPAITNLPSEPHKTDGMDNVNQCNLIKVYKNGQIINPSTLVPGDQIQIAVISTNATQARIRVNGGPWNVTSNKNNNNEYFVTFKIPQRITTFTLEAEVFAGGIWK